MPVIVIFIVHLKPNFGLYLKINWASDVAQGHEKFLNAS